MGKIGVAGKSMDQWMGKYLHVLRQMEKSGNHYVWDSRVWKGEIPQVGAYTLTCSFEALLQNFKSHISWVYALNCKVERMEVWNELGMVRGLM